MIDDEGAADTYWQRHAYLKDAHSQAAHFVRHSFQKALRRWTKSQRERQKLESLLQYVDYCTDVLDESREAAGTASRSCQDLDRVEKYVAKIIAPYVSKHVREHIDFVPPLVSPDPNPMLARSTSSISVHSDDMPSIIDSDISSSAGIPIYNALSMPHPIVLDGDHEVEFLSSGLATSAPIQLLSNGVRTEQRAPPLAAAIVDSVETYWNEHDRLRAAHYSSLQAVQQKFEQFSQQTPHLTAWQGVKVEYMLRHIKNCVDFLDEAKETHPVRPRHEVDLVLASMNQLILPYLDAPTPESEFAVEHAALKEAYLHDLEATNEAFKLYIQSNNAWAAQIRAIQPHVQWACQVLTDSHATSTYTLTDLQAVHDCVGRYVVPYKIKIDRAAAALGTRPFVLDN
ncbi:hypothetical protein H310_05437 [Aphanomyces invadans]|uniref:Uncharacterized protein n=1 Tax=Aphanomyces invadans TaxID=157072 RepID=A0A024U9B4_9STRA|nr:hypothetical protein H310_05437 [Aphanomyces invadans]ETW03001.1 hypothetical protein H310_05437 [Aphanomyces invadans]|eukprot:XP_008868385.1 hypothetical protein H310_05437 [Aphanomyces invadans]